MDINKVISDILNKSMTIEEALKDGTLEEIQAVQSVIASVKEELSKNLDMEPGSQFHEAPDYMVKFDSMGQWSLVKNTLDYSAMNTKPKPEAEAEAGTIDYSGKKPKLSGKQWNTKDIKPKSTPQTKIVDKETRIKDAVKRGKVIDDRKS